MRAIRLIVCGLVALSLCSGVVQAAADRMTGDMDNTPHDLRTLLGIQEICKPCHTPHHAPYYNDGPLWNHALSSLPGLTGYSKLCMGCHDGITAVDSYGYVDSTSFTLNSGTPGMVAGDVRWNIGRYGLADDHPVSIPYPDLADDEEGPPHGLEARADVESYLEDGKVECTSCHRVHSRGSDTLHDEDAGEPQRYILRRTRAGSQICRACHTN
ncbi:MAG TPA: hypothetical protein VNE39_14655 [Planctomycetota bacterium]|nr:hypothetical protein [Planctomycetota bacterium]